MNFTGHDVKQVYSFKVVREKQPEKNLDESIKKSSTLDSNVMLEGEVDFNMRWTLPAEEDDESKGGSEYHSQKDVISYPPTSVPGIHIPDIASWFCNYLALREIENWAEENLERR